MVHQHKTHCKHVRNRGPPILPSENISEKRNIQRNCDNKNHCFHENELRMKAENIDCMKYLNVKLIGLRGQCHPPLIDLISTLEVRKLRPYLKFLTGDYLTYQKKFDQTNKGSPLCRLCDLQEGESTCHILAICPFYETKRATMLKEMKKTCSKSVYFNFQQILDEENPETLTQFILDPTSFNLKTHMSVSDPITKDVFKLSRDICNYIHTERMKMLKELRN